MAYTVDEAVVESSRIPDVAGATSGDNSVCELLEIMQDALGGLKGQQLFVGDPEAEITSARLITQRTHAFLSDICWRRRLSTAEQHRKSVGLLLLLLYRRGELSDYLGFLEAAMVAQREQTEPTVPAQLANDTLQKLCHEIKPEDAAQQTLGRVLFPLSTEVGLCQLAWAIVKVVHTLGSSSAPTAISEGAKLSVPWTWSEAEAKPSLGLQIAAQPNTAKKTRSGSDYATAVSEQCMVSGVHTATFTMGSICENIKVGVVGKRQSDLSDNLYEDSVRSYLHPLSKFSLLASAVCTRDELLCAPRYSDSVKLAPR